jgi:hypothetical protein
VGSRKIRGGVDGGREGEGACACVVEFCIVD